MPFVNSKPLRREGPWAFLLLLAMVVSCKASSSRTKTDQVHLVNGDRITGEIKKLEQGKLKLKTSPLDTVYIEWNKISQLGSTYAFQFEDRNGGRHFGRIVNVQPGTLTVLDEDGASTLLLLENIVEISPIDESFWARLDGNLSLGFNYSKGSDIAQFYSSGQLVYRTRQLRNQVDYSATITKDSDGLSTTRSTLALDLQRYFGRWSGWSTGSLEENEALGLDLRALVAAGGGYTLLSTGHSLLDLGLGLALSEESSASASSTRAVEGLIQATYSVFKFGERDITSIIDLTYYPGITESGRNRTQADAAIRREIAKSLYLELTGYLTHDSEPPSGNEKSDFGVVTSLSWSF